jgi:hypothetical protein
VLDVLSVVTELLDSEAIELRDAAVVATTQPLRGMNTGGTTSIDRTTSSGHDLRTTLRLPLGRPVLVGGMTNEPIPGAKSDAQLLLIVEVTSSN